MIKAGRGGVQPASQGSWKAAWGVHLLGQGSVAGAAVEADREAQRVPCPRLDAYKGNAADRARRGVLCQVTATPKV